MASRFALGLSLLLQVSGALAVGPSAPPVQELVVATVNNDHMLTLQRMTRHFEQQAPGWRVRWVTMDEDRLRQAREAVKTDSKQVAQVVKDWVANDE